MPFVPLPSDDKLSRFFKELKPNLETDDNGGEWAKLSDIVPRITKATIENLVEDTDNLPELLKVVVTCGFDGSGRHSLFSLVIQMTQKTLSIVD